MAISFSSLSVVPVMTTQLGGSAGAQSDTNPTGFLQRLQRGAVIRTTAVGRDAGGGVILHLPQGELILKTDLFIARGTEVTIRLEATEPGLQASIVTIDGKTPGKYAEQLQARAGHQHQPDIVIDASASPALRHYARAAAAAIGRGQPVPQPVGGGVAPNAPNLPVASVATPVVSTPAPQAGGEVKPLAGGLASAVPSTSTAPEHHMRPLAEIATRSEASRIALVSLGGLPLRAVLLSPPSLHQQAMLETALLQNAPMQDDAVRNGLQTIVQQTNTLLQTDPKRAYAELPESGSRLVLQVLDIEFPRTTPAQSVDYAQQTKLLSDVESNTSTSTKTPAVQDASRGGQTTIATTITTPPVHALVIATSSAQGGGYALTLSSTIGTLYLDTPLPIPSGSQLVLQPIEITKPAIIAQSPHASEQVFLGYGSASGSTSGSASGMGASPALSGLGTTPYATAKQEAGQPQNAPPNAMTTPLIAANNPLGVPTTQEDNTWQALVDISLIPPLGAPAQALAMPIIPRLDASLSSSMVFMLSALRLGNFGAGLAPHAQRQLERLERSKPEFAEDVKNVLISIAQKTHRSEGDMDGWQSWQLPLATKDADTPIWMGFYVKFPPHTQDDTPQSGRQFTKQGEQFIVEVQLSRIGRVQVHGMLQPSQVARRSLEVVLRSEQPLGVDAEQQIRQLYAAQLSALGMEGGIRFFHGSQEMLAMHHLQKTKQPAHTTAHTDAIMA